MKKTAVITGGSSGIGLLLTSELVNKGYAVFELSRSGSHSKGVIHIATNVADENSVQSAFARIAAETDRLDLLINNAGFGISGAVEYTQLDEAKRQFDVNFFGMVCSVQNALPLLKSAKGRIVNISSVAAVLPLPFQTFYSAAKAAMNAYSLALANEVKRFGINVCCVMPGDINTGFTAARSKNEAGDNTYNGAIGRSVSKMEQDEKNGMEVIYVARRIARIATKKKSKLIITIGKKYRLFVVLAKFLPTPMVNKLIGAIYAR